jgi:chloramphenicol 3-O-phosphotransferase
MKLSHGFDPGQHPRHPAGTSQGGEFAPAWGSQAQDLYEKNDTDMTTEEEFLAKCTPEERAAIKQGEADVAAGVPSSALVSLGGHRQPNGEYTFARSKLHAKILGGIFSRAAVKASVPDSGIPTLVMLGGRPGAGKTSTMESVGFPFKKDKFLNISADLIQEKLPGYKSHLSGLFNQEAQDIAAKAEKLARKARLNVLYDATMKSTGAAMDRVIDYRKDGYDVEGYFVQTSRETSARRSLQRYMKKDKDGNRGRFVPARVSLAATTNEHTFDVLKPNLTKWALYDNNADAGPPKLVAQGGTRQWANPSQK